jgi:amino acid adenylation domain-containing protein
VAFLARKTPDTIWAIHGALRAGAAYVPIDPEWPASRIAHVLADCDVRFIVADRVGSQHLAAVDFSVLRVTDGLLLDEDAAPLAVPRVGWHTVGEVARTELGWMDPGLSGEDIAAIFYTSGSTGKPKGVVQPHRTFTHWARWAQDLCGIGDEDRIGSVVPLHFDLAAFDAFLAVSARATLAILPDEARRFPVEMARFLEDQRVSIIYWLPSIMLDVLLRGALEQKDLSNLRTVLFAGEPFAPKHLRRWMNLASGTRFYQLYGSTEASQCTVHPIVHPPGDDTRIAIGTPRGEVRFVVVTDDGREARPGEMGELLVQGPTVMKGYWRQPDLTQAAFRQNPLHDNYSDVMFATGDLVIRSADGTLMFVGRKNTQVVKVKGHRVDLAEVEHALSQHERVLESVASVLGEAETARIEAVVLLDLDGVDEKELLRHCRAILPKYMTPAKIRILSELPRTRTGKTDRLRVAEMISNEGSGS